MMTCAITQIRTQNITKRYGKRRALRCVSTQFDAGSVCAVLGPNGAGKSTLLGILSSLVRPTMGSTVYRTNHGDIPFSDVLRSKVGYLSHASLLYPRLSAKENLELYAKLYGLENPERVAMSALEESGVQRDSWYQPVCRFSRGMTQRVSIARAFVANPSVLLLDEPFAGLDVSATKKLCRRVSQLREGGGIVIVVSHKLETVATIASRVLMLSRGTLVTDEQAIGHRFSSNQLLGLQKWYEKECSDEVA